MRRGRDVGALVAFLLLVYAAAFVGGRATASSVDTWYVDLEKPSWTPPGWVIGAVWTVLYALMGVAAWLVWREAGLARTPFALFGAQLGLNVAWSFIFFGLRRPDLAFAEILLLAGAVAATLAAFARVKPLAGGLFAPYLAWVGFAAVLNGTVAWMNR